MDIKFQILDLYVLKKELLIMVGKNLKEKVKF